MRQQAAQIFRASLSALLWAVLLARCIAERYAEWSLDLPHSASSNDALPSQLQKYHRPLEWASPATILQPPKAGLFRIYIADAGGGIQAIDSTTGVLVWSTSAVGRVWSKPAMHITVTAEITLDPEKGFVITSSGDAADDRSRIRETMIVGSSYGVEAYHGDTGDLQWKKDAGPVLATPLVLHASTQVVVATWAGEVLTVDAASGKDKWVQQMGEHLWTAPYSSPDGDFVYVLTEGGKLSKLATASGTAQWTTRCPGKSTPLSQLVTLPQRGDRESLVVVSLEECVAAVSVATGSTVWKVPLGVAGGQAAALSVDADHVLVILPDGVVYTLALDGRVLSRSHWTQDPPLVMGTPVRLVSDPARCMTPARTLVPEHVARQQDPAGEPGAPPGDAPVSEDDAEEAFEAAFGAQARERRDPARRLLGAGPRRDLRPVGDAAQPAGARAVRSGARPATAGRLKTVRSGRGGGSRRVPVGTLRRTRILENTHVRGHTSASQPQPQAAAQGRQLLEDAQALPVDEAAEQPPAVTSAVYVQDGSGAVIDVLTGDVAVIPDCAGAGAIWTPSQSNDSTHPGFLVVLSRSRTLAAVAVSGCELPVMGSQASEVAGTVVVTRDVPKPEAEVPPVATPRSSLVSRLSLAGLVFICILAALPFLVCVVLLAKVPKRLRARMQRSTGSAASTPSGEASSEASISVHAAVRAVLPRSMGHVRSHDGLPASLWTVPAVKLESCGSQPITEDDGDYVPASYLSSGLSMHPVSMPSHAKLASFQGPPPPSSADHQLSCISEARLGALRPGPPPTSRHTLPSQLSAPDPPTSRDADADSFASDSDSAWWVHDDGGGRPPQLTLAHLPPGPAYVGASVQLAHYQGGPAAPSDALQDVDSVALRSGELHTSDADSTSDGISQSVGAVSTFFTDRDSHMYSNSLFRERASDREGDPLRPGPSAMQPVSTLMSAGASGDTAAPYSVSTVPSSRGCSHAVTTLGTSPALRSGSDASASAAHTHAAVPRFARRELPLTTAPLPHAALQGRRSPRRSTPSPPGVQATHQDPMGVRAAHAADADRCLAFTHAAASSAYSSRCSPRGDPRGPSSP